MLPTVHALFPSHEQARETLRQLRSAGIPESSISYVRYRLEAASPVDQAADQTETNTDTSRNKVTAGTTTGAIAGAAAGMGAMAVVGLTPLLIIAPLVVMAGVAVGAAAGATAAISALDDYGVPEAERKAYEVVLRKGGAVLAVRSEDESVVENARRVIQQNGGRARFIRLTKKLT